MTGATGPTGVTGATGPGTTDGWIADTKTWKFSFATVFTVPGDATGYLPIGAKVSYNDGSVDYGIVIGTVYTVQNLAGIASTVATSLFTKTAHGLTVGTPVVIGGLAGTTGVTNGAVYWPVSVTANTFQLSNVLLGSAITLGGTDDAAITATGATTITLRDNTTYSIANATLTAPRYSYAETPQGFPRTVFPVTPAWPLIPPAISAQLNADRAFYQQSPTPGAATRVVVGMAAGPANAGTTTSGDDADGPSQLLTTAASSNAEATMYTATIFRRDWGAIAFGSFKLPSSIAVGAFYAGFTSAALGNNAIPATHCAMFRYRVGTDGTAFWRTATNNAGTGTAQTTTVAVVASTVYRWAIRLLSASVEYYMATADGPLTLVATEASTLPTATTPLAVLTRVQSTDASATAMQWGRHTILMKP